MNGRLLVAGAILLSAAMPTAAPVARSGPSASPGIYRTTPAPVRAAAELVSACREYWEGCLRFDPLAATAIGDRRYDDRLPDRSPRARLDEQRRLEFVLARARSISDLTSGAGRLTRDALIESIDGRLRVMSCRLEEWNVDPLGGPQVELMDLPDYTTIVTPHDAERYILRCRAMAPYLDQHITNLRAGLAAHRVACSPEVRKVIDQLTALERQPIAESPLLAPANLRRDEWSLRDRDRFHDRLTLAVTTDVMPALRRYREFLERDVLPAARPPERAGIMALPGGLENYRALVRTHTSLDRTPEDLHRLGLDEIKRIRDELQALGAKALGTGDIAEIQRRLRADPAMHFTTAAGVEAKAREALGRAQAAIPKWFDVLPRARCEVKVMGMHEAPQSTIAYYHEPAPDGSRPGYYMINTWKPETRPRYEAEALAFHESIPGHHLQIAIAQELAGLPEFRKHEGVTAFVEGWGLYAERLADEMGLYSGDLDRIGMLSYDAWRACRLVVDTGMHAMGWSRQQAIDYMMENTVLAENNIVNEVDRYITNPGQALAYKCGELEILALRDEARRALGDRFDIKQFHAVVLRGGAVALPVLREQVEAWIAEPPLPK